MLNAIKAIGCVMALSPLFSCADDIEAVNPQGSSQVSVSGTLTVVYIDTKNKEPIVSKEVYVDGLYRLDPMGVEGVEPIGSKTEPLPLQIRGRGHSSWNGP